MNKKEQPKYHQELLDEINNENIEEIKLLLQNDIDLSYNDGIALKLAIVKTKIDLEIVKELLKYKPPIRLGHLKDAINYQNLNLLKLLVEYGGDVTINNSYILNLVTSYKQFNDNVEIVKYLVDQGCDVNSNNSSAFTNSVNFEFIKTVNFLLLKGADVHANKDEALISSVRNNNIELFKTLLNKNADIYVRDHSALKLALEENHKEFIEFIVNYYEMKGFFNLAEKIINQSDNEEIKNWLNSKIMSEQLTKELTEKTGKDKKIKI